MLDYTRAHGVLVIDKPSGPTSHDIVTKARRFFQTKVGHTGTLDPIATGVLPLVIGSATRLARFFQSVDKEYLANIALGETTDSFDREGTITQKKPVPEVSSKKIAQVLAKFTGDIQQQPPMFSAVKVGGKKLYELARRNQESERPWRTVSIHRLDLIDRTKNNWTVKVHCSAGTYVRSLAHEIGQTLSCGAYLQNLRRIRSGSFVLNRAVSVEKMGKNWQMAFYPMEELLPELPRVDLNVDQFERVQHGNWITAGCNLTTEFCRLFYNDSLIAIGRIVPNAQIQPAIVLRASQKG